MNSPKQPTQLYQVQSGVGFAFQPRTLPWWLLWIWMTWRCFTAASKLNSRERFHSLKGSCLAVIFCEGSGTFYITKLIVISRIEPWHRNLNYIPPIHLIIWQGKNPTSKRENLDNHTPPQQHTATVGRKNSLLTWSRSSQSLAGCWEERRQDEHNSLKLNLKSREDVLSLESKGIRSLLWYRGNDVIIHFN